MSYVFCDRRLNLRENPIKARRRYPRLETALDVICESPSRTLIAGFADINLRGLMIVTSTPEPAGTPLFLKIKIPEAEEQFEVQGTVAWSRRAALNNPCCGMGVKFFKMSDEARKRIAAFMLTKGGLAAIPQLEKNYKH
jgi:uncharacterized protein (TIGR02266 family)